MITRTGHHKSQPRHWRYRSFRFRIGGGIYRAKRVLVIHNDRAPWMWLVSSIV
jgi:hypothetical protein